MPHVLFSHMIWAVSLVIYWCVLMLSEQEHHVSVCICRSRSDFCIICFALLGTVWLSSWVCKFSKSGGHLSVLCVSRVQWNISHTEDSQILGAAVQNEAIWAMFYPRCVHLCCSVTLELAEVKERKWGQSVSIDSTCLIVVMLCSTGVMQLLVEGMNLH